MYEKYGTDKKLSNILISSAIIPRNNYIFVLFTYYPWWEQQSLGKEHPQILQSPSNKTEDVFILTEYNLIHLLRSVILFLDVVGVVTTPQCAGVSPQLQIRNWFLKISFFYRLYLLAVLRTTEATRTTSCLTILTVHWKKKTCIFYWLIAKRQCAIRWSMVNIKFNNTHKRWVTIWSDKWNIFTFKMLYQ